MNKCINCAMADFCIKSKKSLKSKEFICSQLSLSRSCRDYLIQVQITRSSNLFALRVIWTFKKSLQRQSLVGEKQSKCTFDSDRRFESRRIRDIRV